MSAGATPAVALGLVGLGPWGRVLARTIMASRRLRLAGIASRNREAFGALGTGCRRFDDWRALIGQDGIEGLVIAAPPAVHAEIALAAIAAGVPAFIEKPFTLSLVDAERVAAASRRKGVPVMVDFIHLFAPGWAWLKGRIANLAPLERLISTAGNDRPLRTDVTPLWDWACHDIALMLDITGTMPEAVQCRRTFLRGTPKGLMENVEFRMRFPGGVIGAIACGNAYPVKHRRFDVTGLHGSAVYDDVTKTGLAIEDGRAAQYAADNGQTPPLDRALSAFADMIRSGIAPAVDTLALGIDTTCILSSAEAVMGPSGVTEWRAAAVSREGSGAVRRASPGPARR